MRILNGQLISVDDSDIISGEFKVPDEVTSIGSHAFEGCSSLTSMVFPKGVNSTYWNYLSFIFKVNPNPKGLISIGEGAFSGCSKLTSIDIPESVTSIRDGAFSGCSNLTSIVIRKGITSIGNYAFKDCLNLTSIVIPEGVTSIGKSAFSGCSNLTNIVIPESVTSIDSGAFFDCSSLTNIVIPEGVRRISDNAFHHCTNLTSIVIPEDVTSIGHYAFTSCSSLTSIDIPEGVAWIELYAFAHCTSLTSIVIPESVRWIGHNTFRDCTNLTSIVIPEGITWIGSAFCGCSNLTSIVIVTKTPEEFERIKLFLPKDLRLKAKDINKDINEHMDILEQLISVTADLGNEQEWADNVIWSIEHVQSMIDSIGSTNRIGKELQKRLNSLVVRLYINQGELNEAVDYFSRCSGVLPGAAFELATYLFAFDKPKQKYSAIIDLFKKYDEDDGVHELLEKTVLELFSVLSNEKGTLCKKIIEHGIGRCLPCSAIIKTISESETLDEDLKKQFKAMEDKLPLLTIEEMHRLLGAPPLQEVFNEKYGSTDIVTYERLIMLSDLKEINNYREHKGPIVGHLKEILDSFKQKADINMGQLLTQTNLSMFGNSSSDEQSTDDVVNALPAGKK